MNPEFLTEEQVTPQTVSELLTRAFIKHEIDEDGDLLVSLDGYTSLLVIDSKRRMLKYLLSFTLEQGTQEERDAYANRLNRDYIFAGFHTKEGAVVGEYYLPFDGGVMPYHIVYCLRKMHDLVPDVTASGDTDNLLGRDLPGLPTTLA